MERSPSGEPVDKKPLLAPDGSIISSTTIGGANTIQSDSTTTQIKGSNNNTTGSGERAVAGNLTVEQLDIEILPVLYDIIRCVEKDPLDNTAKQRESAECSQKILELQKRFESARGQVRQLIGIDFNKDEQLQQLEQLRNQLRSKQNLLLKYKDTEF